MEIIAVSASAVSLYGGNFSGTTGVKQHIYTAVSTGALTIWVSPLSAFVGSVSNISVKEVQLKQHTLSKSSGIVNCDYLDLSNSNATGGATWYAGSHSVDTTNNDGWIFEDAPAAPTYVPRHGATNFQDPGIV